MSPEALQREEGNSVPTDRGLIEGLSDVRQHVTSDLGDRRRPTATGVELGQVLVEPAP